MSREGKKKNFSGMKVKEKFYEKRKMLKQQKKFGLAVTSRKNSSKANKKNNKRTSLKQKKNNT